MSAASDPKGKGKAVEPENREVSMEGEDDSSSEEEVDEVGSIPCAPATRR